MVSLLDQQTGCEKRYLFEHFHVIFRLHHLLGCHSKFRAGSRDVVLIALHGAGGLVVNVVGVTPRVVWRQDEGVRNVADGVVYPLVIRESAVASIMANTENPATNEALEPPVCGPERPLEGGGEVRVEAGALECLNEGVDLLRGLGSEPCQRSYREGN